MTHVFISYSKRNKSYARLLADYLIASGFDVWIDDRIDYGALWVDVIQKAIEDCDAFVVVMTPDARESQWVQTECEYAAHQTKPIFPLLLEGDVFFRYVSIQYVDVSEEQLPPEAFLAEVAEVAPRRPGPGANVTAREACEVPPFPVRKAKIGVRRRLRRRVPWRVALGGMGAILLLIAAIIVLNSRSSDTLETPPPESSDQIPLAGSGEDATTLERACKYDWFFSNAIALEGECPKSYESKVGGLVQEFGDGILLSISISEGDQGQYFLLSNDGSFQMRVSDWDFSSAFVGSCVLESTVGSVQALGSDSVPDEVMGCPAEPVRDEMLNYQVGSPTEAFVVYVGTDEGEVYRLAAPSSRPNTQGTWQRLQ